MQAIIETLDFINNYTGYLYIVVFIVVMVMLVRVLLALIRLHHSAADFDVALESVSESFTTKMAAIKDHRERAHSLFSKSLKAITIFQLSRMYLSSKKRAELRKAKDDAALRMQRDKYVRRLLKP